MNGSRSIMLHRDAVATLLAAHIDIVSERPTTGELPRGLAARGWLPFLQALGDDALDTIEAGDDLVDDDAAAGAWAGAPSSLLSLVREARALTALPLLAAAPATTSRRHEPPRKQVQIDAFAQLVAPLAARAQRIVDVGAGHGHLTRQLAERMGMPVLGLEHDPALVGRARSLAGGAAVFDAVDALDALDALNAGDAGDAGDRNTSRVSLGPGDCLVGLHACGALGDAMVARVARGAAASMALVGCCLQKRRGRSRAPLSVLPSALASALTFDVAVLGLSNFTAREDGVEASRADNATARRRRLALHQLLVDAGVALSPWAEIDGLNRRSAHGPLAVLVARAFALRGLAPPSAAAIDEAAHRADAAWATLRRLSLPRIMLARTLEVFVLLDRAAALVERGADVTVGLAFPSGASARNTVLMAARGSS